MNKSYPKFICDLEKSDPVFYEEITKIFDLAMAPGELDPKTKVLIAMSLDALNSAGEGVKTLANIARNMGVSDAQISEALRIVYLVAGNKVIEAINAAFEK